MAETLKELSDKELLRLIVDELEGVIVADAEGRYVYANVRWCTLTGRTLSEVRGKYVRDVVPLTKVDYALRTQKFISGDAILTNVHTGAEVPVYCSYTPLFQSGKLTGCLVYMIQKSETTSLGVPSNAVRLMESLDMFLKQLGHSNTKYTLESIIGESTCMRKFKDEIVSVARSGSTVLIEGETGSGKELVAHAIHNLSPRNDSPFIKVNCAAIPSELMETEFFGYEAGSFTGAQKGGKIGKFERASGGSLFLDEINQLPLRLQPKFLRVLQEHEIERVGAVQSTPIDTRVIAATNVPLADLVKTGEFRSDLYYRLDVLHLRVPPLRERREDIPGIANHMLTQLNFRLQLQIPYIDDEAMKRLMEYDWPGNVRELNNVIEKAMNLSWTEPLQWEHFSGYFNQMKMESSLESEHADAAGSAGSLRANNRMLLKKHELEREIILQAIQDCGGNKSATAKTLGISRTALYKKLHQYRIS